MSSNKPQDWSRSVLAGALNVRSSAASGACQTFHRAIQREVGGVTIATKVSENDFFEGSFQLGEDPSGRGVRQVPVARENALLNRPRATKVVLQKGFIVVCLDKDCANSTKRVKNQTGGITEVCEHSETGSIAGNSKTDRIHSVVRN